MDWCTDISPTPHLHFTSFVTFLSIFLKLLGLEETVPKASAGSWFQSWMVLFKKQYFPISVLCCLLLIFLSLGAETLYKLIKVVLSLSVSFPQLMTLFAALSVAVRGLPEHEPYASAYAKPEHLAYASAYSKPVDYYVSWNGTARDSSNLGVTFYYPKQFIASSPVRIILSFLVFSTL
jgi:hypothetical protein